MTAMLSVPGSPVLSRRAGRHGVRCTATLGALRGERCSIPVFHGKRVYGMEMAAGLLAPAVTVAAWCIAASVLLLAAWRAPWRALLAVSARQHVLFAGVMSLALLWAVDFHPAPGITLHYLGMTTATVLFGWALAVLAGLAALLVLVLTGVADAAALPLTWLLTAVLPALTITGLLWLLERTRLRNLFFFLLGIGFAGAMLTTVVLALAALAVLAVAGQATLANAALAHAPLLLLLMFSEGFINGAAITTITVYFPHMVRGFNEERFLGEP